MSQMGIVVNNTRVMKYCSVRMKLLLTLRSYFVTISISCVISEVHKGYALHSDIVAVNYNTIDICVDNATIEWHIFN